LKRIEITAFFLIIATTALAQDQSGDAAPLGAIDWLNDPAPITVARPLQTLLQEPGVEGATVPRVSVMPLDETRPDAAGLLPASSTGLPSSLWVASSTDTLVSLFSRLPSDPLPAMAALYYTLLLAEADPPADAGPNARFLTARLVALRALGAVDPALALVEQAGPTDRAVFDQWFDLALLSGTEDAPCAALAQTPDLSALYASRIYCTARAGDWQTAALTYETASAVGLLDDNTARLLAQYLDPETIEDTQPRPSMNDMTPLIYRLYEAAGTPLPTSNLPREFAVGDMRGMTGLKAEIEAAERLTRTGALPANRLLGLYTDHSPAASGGVWDRVSGIQRLEEALDTGDTDTVDQVLPPLWRAMKSEGLGVAFATLFAEDLSQLPLTCDARETAFNIALLSPAYETLAPRFDDIAQTARTRFLTGIARGTPDAKLANSTTETAIGQAFATQEASPDHASMLSGGRLGQAILTAALQLDTAGPNQASDITAGLATLRAVGLEDSARRAALQILLLKAAR